MSLGIAERSYRTAHGPTSTKILLLLNAVFSGSLGVPLVLTLNHHGVSKSGIAAFFVVWNLGGAAINLIRHDRLKSKLGSSAILMISSAVVGLGLTLAWFSSDILLVLAAGLCMAAYSVQYPIYVGRYASDVESPQGLGSSMAGVRRIWIAGYIAGLGLYAGIAFLGWRSLQVPAATLFATIVLQALWRRTRERRDTGTAASGAPITSARNRLSSLLLLGLAITLLRATDSLRATYFPLFAQNAGLTASAISLLFVVTAVCELFILRPLGRVGDRTGSNMPLVFVSIVGFCAMALIAIDASLWSLFLSQVLYAFFVTGFQMLGVQKFVEASRHAERGASLFQGSMQLGSLIGVLLPLLIDGYGGGTFAIGAGLCATATLALLINARKRGDSCQK
ncbi:Predicted arabinose efflux permease, MFS family [Microbacterium azadirachtae]|uniref:Predicted arabinose efflux permease, MFS family n=1 Tax=Microbacterium azadirachtae TaxID=582680 RepID=A0A1I6G029_9MICO|nr:MFS transporter [Microbacterium azadirachtae]SFR35490.1 Predicted arabinose efflux permease, MFS family [Microbacterium azadirachtae]